MNRTTIQIKKRIFPVYHLDDTWRKNPSLYDIDSYFVYVIYEKDSNMCKIGMTSNVVNRFRQIEGNNPHELVPFLYIQLIYSKERKTERMLHEVFEKYKIPDRKEWFEIHPYVVLRTILRCKI